MDMSEQERIRDDRLRWQCRRALLELDIVFQRFWAQQEGVALDEKTAESLSTLLAREDHDLWNLVNGSSEACAENEQMLLQRLRSL